MLIEEARAQPMDDPMGLQAISDIIEIKDGGQKFGKFPNLRSMISERLILSSNFSWFVLSRSGIFYSEDRSSLASPRLISSWSLLLYWDLLICFRSIACYSAYNQNKQGKSESKIPPWWFCSHFLFDQFFYGSWCFFNFIDFLKNKLGFRIKFDWK